LGVSKPNRGTCDRVYSYTSKVLKFVHGARYILQVKSPRRVRIGLIQFSRVFPFLAHHLCHLAPEDARVILSTFGIGP